MKAFRRPISHLTIVGWLAAAFAAGPVLAQSVVTPRLELNAPKDNASNPKLKVKATRASQYNVWEEDDAAEAAQAQKAPRVLPESAKEASPIREASQSRVVNETQDSRVVRDSRVTQDQRTVPDPRLARQPQGRPQRSPSYVPVGNRSKPVGFVPRHQRVVGAQFLGEDPAPMTEDLPAPLPPNGMGVPGANGQGGIEPVPHNNLPGGRSIINGRNGMSAPPHGMGQPMIMGGEMEGGMPFGGDPFNDLGGGDCASCGGGDCGGFGGGYVGPFGGRFRECFPCLFVNLKDLDIFSGVQGFTNSTNRGGTGSFGYHFGFNKGRAVYCLPCTNLTWQFGLAGVFSNFDGATFNNGGALATTPANRNQLFMTGGLFRRVDWGLQFGFVFDYLHEDWYANMDIAQVRGEISWVYPTCHELGFWFAAGVNPGRDNAARIFAGGVPVNPPPVEQWAAIDLYAFFYRYRFAERGGEARSFGGFTGEGEGLVGGDFWLPVNNNWSFQADYTYLIPNNNGGLFANTNEGWNLGIHMVWSPGFCRNNSGADYNRPLFNVANNGNFILRRR